MRVLNKELLVNFWRQYPEAEEPLKAWVSIIRNATSLAAIMKTLPKAYVSHKAPILQTKTSRDIIEFEIIADLCYVRAVVKYPALIIQSISTFKNNSSNL
jgi:mRNA-degrading endonuclease HigB of HigAB toxin-antitoxin module